LKTGALCLAHFPRKKWLNMDFSQFGLLFNQQGEQGAEQAFLPAAD
jgi:hypothetical protein